MFGAILVLLERFYGSRESGAITNRKAFMWFCAVICAIIIRREASGIVIGTLQAFDLDSKYYPNVDDLFRSKAVDFDRLLSIWADIVEDELTFHEVDGRLVYVTDGVNNPKEGRMTSTVTRITKESGTQSKPSSFHGASTASLNILSDDGNGKIYSVPIAMWFSSGFAQMAEWEGTPCPYAALPTEQQEIEAVMARVKEKDQKAYLLADRASMSHNSFDRLQHFRETNPDALYLVTCCKNNTVAFCDPRPEDYKGVGRHAVLGEKVFMDRAHDGSKVFKEADIYVYGRKEHYKYWSKELIWGEKKNSRRRLLFVIAIMSDGRRIVLATDKLDMDPLVAIELYAKRFLCEEGFKQFKHTLHGFDYHFWSKSMPWNSFLRKKEDPHPLDSVTDKAAQAKIMDEFRAGSLALQMAVISQGLTQIVGNSQEVGGTVQRFTIKRTATRVKVSEHDVCNFFAENLPSIMKKYKDYEFIRFIKARQRESLMADVLSIL